MKHSAFTLGAMLAATFALSSCNESLSPLQPTEGVPFEISTLLTKTSNDGLNTVWASGDAINLFHAEADATTYTSDGQFTVDDALAGVFSGTLASALDESKSYDWYANYPYSSYQKTPAGVSQSTGAYITVGGTSQTQAGNDSRAHLAGTACPLYGVAKNVASDVKPAIEMKQLASVVAVKVTNTLEDALTVSSVSFTSSEDIVGTYYIDYSGDAPAYKLRGESYVSKTATLTVTDGTAIAQNSSAVFYIALKPHTAASGSTLKISVNGVEKTLTLTKDVTFTAGHIKTLQYEYDQAPADYSGTYVILNKDKTKVCPAYTEEKNNIPAEDYSASNIQDSWVMTIEKVSGTSLYTIKDANGMYLSTGSTKDKNYMKGLSAADEKNSYWSITPSSDGTYYSIVATESSYRNVMQYNSNNSLFSCYEKENQTNVIIVECTILPRISAPASIDAEVRDLNSIYVCWETVEGAKDYTVTCGGESVTVTGDEHTFTGLSYSTEYTISVVTNPTDTDTYRPSLPVSTTLTTDANPSGTSYTLQFGSSYNSKGVTAYTSSWSATCEGTTWNITNFNNNSNKWEYVKAGRKNNASVATITTASALPIAVSTVTLTIDAVTSTYVNSIYLQVSSTNDFSSSDKITLGDVSVGAKSISISSPSTNCYYKLTFDIKSANDNGPIQISKVVYSN